MHTQEMIKNGMTLVLSSPAHNLEAGFRCRLLASLDAGSDGRRRRTKLAVSVVKKVLPLWEASLPTDNTPHKAMDLAEKIIVGTVSSSDAEAEMGRLWATCDDLSWKHTDKQTVIMVGYAAVQAVREALSEKHFGCGRVSDESSDMDVDPFDHDSSFCAAIAYSGGPPWQKNSSVDKRLEFWTWWLESVGREMDA